MKNVLITGSSRGIGYAIAKRFAEIGCKVVLNCRKSERELHRAAFDMGGGNAGCLLCDVSVYDEAKRLVEFTNERFGKIDVLVNNAGAAHYRLFTDDSPQDFERVFGDNFYSVCNCTHAVLPQMIRAKEGHIINVSSVWGSAGASCEVMYSAAKGAVNAFTKAVAKEVAPSNVFVNAVAPGVINTGMNRQLSADEREDLRNAIPLGRFGSTADVALLCEYLAKTDYMTGQILTVDGAFV